MAEKGWPEFLPPFRLINQGPDSGSCVGCCAAMLAGSTVAEFEAFCGHPAPWNDDALAAFCMGYSIWVSPPMRRFDPVFKDILEGTDWQRRFRNRAAVLSVQSERWGPGGHAVLWTGAAVADPLFSEIREPNLYDVSRLAYVSDFCPRGTRIQDQLRALR